MEIVDVLDNRLVALVNLYDLYTQLFVNVLEGISDEKAHRRFNTKATHVAWIAGSLVSDRFALAIALDLEVEQHSHELFDNFKSIEDSVKYPPLSEFKADWLFISPLLKDKIVRLEEERLNGSSPFEMPGQEMTLYDTIFFFIHREAYCIGQIGLWRRLLGYDAMKYE
jgi:hypothetical protein